MLCLLLFCLESQLACIDGYGKFKQQGIDESTYGPDSHGDEDLGHGRSVFVDLSQGVRHKARDDEPHTFLDVDAYNDKDAGHVEGSKILPGPGKEEEEEGSDVQECRKPNIGTSFAFP